MSAIRLDGRALSARLEQAQLEYVQALKAQGVTPTLAVILVGEDAASQIYVRKKEQDCESLGICSRVLRLPVDTTAQALYAQIDQLNADAAVHGILIQLPLPRHLDEQSALMRVDAKKDVDGFHLLNSGALLRGEAAVLPCTPRGIIALLKAANVPLDGAHAVVVGRSNIVGKPVALLLLQENCTVTLCHSHTKNLASLTRQADILVVAVGKAKMITADMVKPGAAVIDVGMNRVNGKLCGDVDAENVQHVAGWLSPVPGGVGPMTVRMLMENTLEAACRTLR